MEKIDNLLSLSIPSFETKRNIKNAGKNTRKRTKKEKERKKEGNKSRRKENEQTRNKLNLKRADNSSAKFSEQRCKE